MGIQVLTPRIKPIRWDIQPAMVAPKWRDFRDHISVEYAMWERGGDVLRDTGKFKKNADIVSAPPRGVTPNSGRAVFFDGSADYALMSSAIPDLDDFMIECVFATTTTAGPDSLYGVLETGNNDFIQYRINSIVGSGSLDDLQFSIRKLGGAQITAQITALTLDWRDGLPHHHLLWRKAGTAKVWIDGQAQPITFTEETLAAETLDFVFGFSIGGRNNRGTIDQHADVDVSLWRLWNFAGPDAFVHDLAATMGFGPIRPDLRVMGKAPAVAAEYLPLDRAHTPLHQAIMAH